MLNGSRTRHSGDGHAWNSMSHMQLGRLWGGSYFWEGVRKKGGSDEPPEHPLVTGLLINAIAFRVRN